MSQEPINDDDWRAFAVVLGVELHRVRIARRLTQEDLAYAAGLSRYTYQKLEKGESRPGTPANPSLRNVIALAQVLDVSLEDLVRLDGLPSHRP
jgi:transcriptional regulator with XRE-family HTH domain